MRRLLIMIAGLSCVVLGMALLILPGPGILLILAGLGILALEFPAARRSLERIRKWFHQLRR